MMAVFLYLFTSDILIDIYKDMLEKTQQLLYEERDI